MTRLSSLNIALMAALLLSAPAAAQTTQQSYDDLFGPEAAKVAKSSDPKASGAFAEKLLKYSDKAKDEPALAQLLLEKAYEFGCKDGSGYSAALTAAREHQRLDETSKATWQEKVLAVMRLRYQHALPSGKARLGEDLAAELCDTGDELAAQGNYEQAAKLFQEASRVAMACKLSVAEEAAEKFRAANAKVTLVKKLKAMEDQLAKKPDDAPTAKSAALLALTQLDDPARADKFAPASDDDAIKKFVPLATKEPKELSPDEALGLGDWLCMLAEKGEKPCKIALLTRAKKCYEDIVSRDEKGVNGIAADRKLDQTLQKLARLHLGERKITLDLGKGVTLKIVLVPAGQLKVKDMGVIKRTVAISKPVYIGVTEVTRQQYQAIMGGAAADAKGDNASLPAANIGYGQALEFCKRLSKKTGYSARLPGEAQWEFAARAGSETDYGFAHAEDLDDHAWYDHNSKNAPHAVATREPNALGLYDMLGNVWEWCGPPEGVKEDPKPDSKGHPTRGGSYIDAKGFLHCSSKVDRPADFTNDGIGFRIAVEAKE